MGPERDRRLYGLYAITDENLIQQELFAQAVEAALLGGTKIFQYRDKSSDTSKRLYQAKALVDTCRQYNATSIINDDIDLAKTVGADGVHLGFEDDTLEDARARLGDTAIIGISCYDDVICARDAEKRGASYVAFGAMFPSSTKPNALVAGPEIITQAKQSLRIPVCVIGGITSQNIESLIQKGADMSAVISDIFSHKNVKFAAQQFSQHY